MSSTNDFLQKTHPLVRPIAKATIKSITDSYGKFDTDMKWGQLTFALNGDFDHWICAVSTTKKVVYVKFHFGSLLKDRHGLFSADSGKFIRKLDCRRVGYQRKSAEWSH